MENIRFKGSKKTYPVEFVRLCDNRILIISQDLKVTTVNTEEIELVNDEGEAYGIYEGYNTLYQEIDGGFILSNDGSVYEEIIPKPSLEYEDMATPEE